MSAPMHTPGPWVVNPFKAWVDSTTDFCEDGMPVPICALAWPTNYRSEAVTYANADLIAAAPELLKALEGMIEERWADLHSHMTREEFDRHFASELAAIAKARGDA